MNILYNLLKKGEKSGRYNNITGVKMLKIAGDELELKDFTKDVFLYHLHLLQVLSEAAKGQLYTYHFALLRQLLENVASFLGTGRVSHALAQIGVEKPDDAANVINTHSHKNIYYDQTEMMNGTEEGYFNDILGKLVNKYQFVF